MKISTTILSIKDDVNLYDKVKMLDKTDMDYLHLDIMDGKFVPNITWNLSQVKSIISNTTKPIDIHLMVDDVDKYVDIFKEIKPYFITFHYESSCDIDFIIDCIKENDIKVGISIKPETDIEVLKPYLDKIDLILIMSVSPGFGGQKFLDSSISKIDKLKQLRLENNYNYLIEVDGGINKETIKFVKNADIVAVGSYITNSNNYDIVINELKDIN